MRFNSISAALNIPSVGNFLDAVSVCYLNTGYETLGLKGQPLNVQNPFQQNIHIDMISNKAKPISLSIFNLDGKQLFKQPNYFQEGKNHLTLSPGNLHNGIYLLKFESDSDVFYKKIIRQN